MKSVPTAGRPAGRPLILRIFPKFSINSLARCTRSLVISLYQYPFVCDRFSTWDDFPFDRSGQNLGYAYLPEHGRDVLLNDKLKWTVGAVQPDGFDLVTMAAHELGHSLGLTHSRQMFALMSPFYEPPRPNCPLLKADDIRRIQVSGNQFTRRISVFFIAVGCGGSSKCHRNKYFVVCVPI